MTPNSVFYGPIEMPQTYRSTEATGSLIKLLRISSFFPPLVHWRFKFQALKKKKKKRERERVDLRHFNSSALEIIKRACSVKDKRDFFHYPCNNHQAPPLSSCFLPPSLSLPFSLSLSLSHIHTQEGIQEQGPWEDTAILWTEDTTILWTQDPNQRNIWSIDLYYGNWWK